MIYFNNNTLFDDIPKEINVVKISENSFKYCIKPENYTPEILSWINENIKDVKIQVEKLNYVPIKRDKFNFNCTTLPIDYIENYIYNCRELRGFIEKTIIEEMKNHPNDSCNDWKPNMTPYDYFIHKVKNEGKMLGFTSQFWYEGTQRKINENMAKLIGLNISIIISRNYNHAYYYHKVQIFKLTSVVKQFLEDLLKTYVRKDMDLYEIFKDPFVNWCYNYGDVITREEVLELLKLFDDEKPKEKIKVEEKFDSYDQILEDNKKLAQKCKSLMDENKMLKQKIQQLQCKITTDSSSYYSDSSE